MKAPFRVTNVARSYTTRMKRMGMHQSRRVILLGTKRLLPSSRPDRGTVQLSEEEMLQHKDRLAAHIDRYEVRVWDADGREIPSKELLTFGEPIHCAEPEAIPGEEDAQDVDFVVSEETMAEAKDLLNGNVKEVNEALGESEDADFLLACKLAEANSKKPRKGILAFIEDRLEALD